MRIVNPTNWIEWREGGIGSSDAPAVMEMSPWMTRLELWQRKTGRLGPQEQTYPMLQGLRMEPKARTRYQEMTGIEVEKKLVMHDSHDHVRASLDGINLQVEIQVEIKCPLSVKDHLVAKAGQIPDKYLHQCVHQLAITGYDRLDYFSFHKDEGIVVPFYRDKKLEKQLLAEESRFWECVTRDVLPNKLSPMENVMNSNNRSPYTAKEVVEILQKAKEMGATFIKLEGFEAAFDLAGHEPKRVDVRAEQNPICDRCESEMTLGTYGPYCKWCYMEKKEREKKSKWDFPIKKR